MTTSSSTRGVAVLGAGGWGTALAIHLGRIGLAVHLWARDDSLVSRMTLSHVNDVYLPGVELPQSVRPTSSLEQAVVGAHWVVSAVPSHGTRDVLRRAYPHLSNDVVIVSVTKGLENETLLRMSEVIGQEIGTEARVTVLSGPSFSMEVAQELPTAVSIAGRCADTVAAVQEEFRSRNFRLYATDDVIGVEIGGAMKNVIAIAAGVVQALGLGQNALSALMTRGLAEISRLAVAVGGRRETLAGLSGLGDLVLTCTGTLSRNRRVGVKLGRGQPLELILSGMSAVAEGVRTTQAALELGSRHRVELPITAMTAEVLAGRKTPQVAFEELMLRRQRSEVDAISLPNRPAL